MRESSCGDAKKNSDLLVLRASLLRALRASSGNVSSPTRSSRRWIERHWDGIASCCHPENKVSLGLVEGLNTKIRVLQRRAYGYRDKPYRKLKIIAAFLPPLPRDRS